MTLRSFASDNASGVHPEVLQAIVDANDGHALAYGRDPWTEVARERFRDQFGSAAEMWPVFGGTGANVVALAAVTESYQAVICAETSHLWQDECGAPERIAALLRPVPVDDRGTFTSREVEPLLTARGDVHRLQPRVISITNATEMGGVYRPEEIRALADFSHANDLLLHVDGSRLSNAAAALDLTLGQITTDVGVDLLSFGGTKNGLMGAEAVVFLRPDLASGAPFHRKQSAQLASKMRFLSAQLSALLTDDLWRRNAAHANSMAQRLAARATRLPGVELRHPVEANGVFVSLPPQVLAALGERFTFEVWDPTANVARWMTSFDTTDDDIDRLIGALEEELGTGRSG